MRYDLAVFCISDVRDMGVRWQHRVGKTLMYEDERKHLHKGHSTGVSKDASNIANLLLSHLCTGRKQSALSPLP